MLYVFVKMTHSFQKQPLKMINMSSVSQPCKFKQCVKFWLPKKQLEAI